MPIFVEYPFNPVNFCLCFLGFKAAMFPIRENVSYDINECEAPESMHKSNIWLSIFPKVKTGLIEIFSPFFFDLLPR